MSMDPAQRAFVDQAIAEIGAEVDNLVDAVRAGSAENGREQTIADFTALFQRNYPQATLAVIAALALVRLADR